MPVVARIFHRFNCSTIAWQSHICYALLLSLLPWTRSLPWLALSTFCFGLSRGTVDVSTNTLAILTERAYGSAIMSSLQGCWSLGGVIGASFSSVLLRQHASARLDLAAAAVIIVANVLISRNYLLPEEASVDPPSGWAFLPRALWAVAGIAFLAFFIEGAVGDWSTVYLRSTLGVSASRAATGYGIFSFAMMAGCFIGDHIKMKLGATRLLQLSGALVTVGVGCALLGRTYAVAMIGLLIAGFGLSNMVALVFGAAAQSSPGAVGAAIAATASVGYLGFLVGSPAVGSLSGLLGLRAALTLVILAGAIIAVSARKAFHRNFQ
jgi:predicted MFS family arabinose efflux permease